jgi:hypothetical protein
MADVLIVGETNPFGGNQRYALYYEPRSSSGNQLRLILGMSDKEYDLTLDKMNLCVGRWSVHAAREAWSRVVPRPLIVLLGQKVRAATEGPAPFETERRGPSLLLGLPHPSGLNRLWHEPGSRRRARDAFEAARAALTAAPAIPEEGPTKAETTAGAIPEEG